MALQLDADIENKCCNKMKTNDPKKANEIQKPKVTEIESDENEIKSLYEQFQSFSLLEESFCQKNVYQKVFYIIKKLLLNEYLK